VQELDCYIAPWALPNELVPVHLIWEESLSFDEIRIELPHGIVMKDIYNVEKYILEEDAVRITSLKAANFLGFNVTTQDLFGPSHIAYELKVIFLNQGKIATERALTANFYRPKLEIMECPRSIHVPDKAGRTAPIRIKLKLSGFGRISVKTESNIGGGFVAQPEALFKELVSRLLMIFRESENQEKIKKPISIDREWLEGQVKEYTERLSNGEFPADFNQQDVAEFRDWLSNSRNSDAVKELLSRQLETIVIDSLLYYLDRFPSDDIELKQGTPSVCIESATEGVLLRFSYRDSLNNEYPPLEASVSVDDKRADKKKSVEIPIAIEWLKKSIVPGEEGECR
jgi:hypothetical protein